MAPVRDAILIEKVVTASYDEFLESSWLNEHHPSDQIVNVLRGDERNSPPWNPSPQAAAVSATGQARRRRAGELAQKCASPVPAGKALSAAQWESTLLQQFTSLIGDFVATERSLVEANARQWTKDAQEHLVKHVAVWTGRVGLAPTERMLRRLKTELDGIASGEMQREGEDMRGRSQGFEPAIKQALGTDSGQLDGNDSRVTQALAILQSASERASEAELLEMMPALLRDVAQHLVEPLADACEVALSKLRADVVGDGGSAPAAAAFRTYPDIRDDAAAGVVSPRYIPRQVERLIIDANTFPKEVGSLIRSDLPDEDRESWLSLATVLSLEGVPLRSRDKESATRNVQNLITVDEPWVPADVHLRRDSSLAARPIEASLPASLEDFVDRTQAWLSDDQSAFGRLYRMPINKYSTSGSAKEKLDRQKRFTNAFTDIIRLSAPLVDMDNSSIVAFHQHSDPALTPTGRQVAITTVPFEGNSETGKACADILTASGLDPAQVNFDGAAAERDVFAFSTVKSGMQPMVFSSLIKPISDSWLSSSINPISQSGFWSGRRARPLAEAIPLPPEIRLSMVVGWFIAIFFQQRRQDSGDPNKGTKIDVFDPQFGWLGFPFPLLPKSPQDKYWLPAVLKSLSLAIIESGVQGSERPLLPYWRLKNLGREVTADSGVDMWDGPELSNMVQDWVSSGVLPDGAPQPVELESGARELEGDRRGALLSRVQHNMELYREYWESLKAKDSVDPRGWIKTPEMYEIRADIDQALQMLYEYVRRISEPSSGPDMDG